jgi:hypothetical protein|tara:strand:- start:597 stop:779 length:183 start_codon:yes stop_codon:yes gene_type:complete
MTTRWEKRDKKHSAKRKLKQSNNFVEDDSSLIKKRNKKKRHRPKDIHTDYTEYINEVDVE